MKGAGCHQFAKKIRVLLEETRSMDIPVLRVEGCEMIWKTSESSQQFCCKGNLCGMVSLIPVIIWTVVVRVAV